ncbi:DUF6538 domain-containing protein [Methylosinus sp. Ce-a6]|uniref:DUF6538 domain-containing protein n=1 Tax=Methylosinus sp. Ce-a6 TaxID=2172005 RepID=UPI001357CEE8|nr:DUF6538 domain-containing protein [Methylosinus sp. Ce-a6]
MPAIPHVVRRGAFYYWRRRLPSALAESRNSATLILGLGASNPRRARYLAGQISALADRCFFPAAMTSRLSQQQIQKVFRVVFTQHLDKLEAVTARERAEDDFDPEKSRRSERVMGHVYRLLETRGRAAVVDERAAAQMAAQGIAQDEIAEIAFMLDLMQRQNVAAEKKERLATLVEEVGGEPNPMNLALAQETVYRAFAEANFQSERRHDGVRVEIEKTIADILKDHAKAPRDSVDHAETRLVVAPLASSPIVVHREAAAETAEGARTEHAAPLAASAPPPPADPAPVLTPTPSPAKVARTKPLTLDEHPFVVLAEGVIKKNTDAKAWDTKTQRQVRQISRLFARLLLEQGVVEFEDIHQKHLGDLDDLFGAVAKSYGRSPRDNFRTLDQLRAIGAAKPPSERGLVAGTVNRHFSFLGQILAHIRSRGHKLDRDIDMTLMRRKSTERGRAKRGLLTKADAAAIFRLAFFTGCAGWKDDEVLIPGPHVFHRALYFATLMLHYTGARREEICGLSVHDVASVDAVIDGEIQRLHYIKIGTSEIRRIKNLYSERSVVLHPELIRLGFLDYVAAVRALGYEMVFPDLKSPTSSSPLGDRLYDELIDGLHQAIPDAKERKKVIHSMRKSFGNSLKQEGIHSEIRSDIMGHSGATPTEEIYCDAIALADMLPSIMKIPIVTTHLQPQPIRLLPWVETKLPPPFSRKRKEADGAGPGRRRTRKIKGELDRCCRVARRNFTPGRS